MPRIGVFVCWCGRNIAGTVDTRDVARKAQDLPDVATAVDYTYMCSEPGQKMIRDSIIENKLDAIVIGACSPKLHESTFRRACSTAGLNPYMCEIANIREQCSWVHRDMEQATLKSQETIATLVQKIRANEALSPIQVPVTHRALVIGGGISGIEAALSIANNGHEVFLVEKDPFLGGNVARLSHTFTAQESIAWVLAARVQEVMKHPKIKIYTNSTVEDFSGYVGNFKARISKRATHVDSHLCNGCGICIPVCPIPEPDRHPSRQALKIAGSLCPPGFAVIDRNICLHFSEGCRVCADVCPQKAVDFKQEDAAEDIEVGAVVIATGYSAYPMERLKDFGAAISPDVIDGLQFEAMLAAWERDRRPLRRPSDGKEPREIVFIQCAGSRDREKGVSYCSRICCMTTAKHAQVFGQAASGGQAYVFYSHLRSGGKGFEEFVQTSIVDDKTLYLRGDVSRIFMDDGVLKVWGNDALSGRDVEIAADLVVLATPLVPSKGSDELAKILRVTTDENGFFAEIHPKMRPVESPSRGIFLAGCAQSPRDIPESIAHALGAAGKVQALFSTRWVYQEPMVVYVDEDYCSGCGVCIDACPYGARKIDEWTKKAKVIEILCQGCGACAVACPNGATQQRNFTKPQIMGMIDAALRG